ncbi:MAG TPA: sugar phosphate isomerase/epimerase, partial [Vicinamibacteria bacterium]
MPEVPRRTIVTGLAALAAATAARDASAAPLPLAFSTLGCPGWDLAKILEQGQRLGYAAVELRGIAG